MTTIDEAGRVLDQTIYHRRWQIETSFSELKVFQKMKALRGRTPGSIDYEIASHVLLYLLVRWLMVEAAVEHGQDPLRLSFTEALREIKLMAHTNHRLTHALAQSCCPDRWSESLALLFPCVPVVIILVPTTPRSRTTDTEPSDCLAR